MLSFPSSFDRSYTFLTVTLSFAILQVHVADRPDVRGYLRQKF